MPLPAFAAAAGSDGAIACIGIIGGPVSVDTTLNAASSYCVTSSLVVNPGVTLTIQPGAILEFFPHTALQIDGTLIARGTAASKIVFTSANAPPLPGDWGYIYFSSTSVPASYDSNGDYASGSVIQYATIQYSGGATVNGNTGAGAIQALVAAPYLDHNVIQKNKNDGIDITGAGITKITNNQILFNGTSNGAGIKVSQPADGQSTVLSGNVISATKGFGVYFDSNNPNDAPNVTITKNTITANSASGVYLTVGYDTTGTVSENTVSANNGSGIEIGENGGSNVTVAGNLISGNIGSTGGGIRFNTPGGAGSITGNTIHSNIATDYGGGIYVFSTSAVSVSGNTVSSNTAAYGGGIYIEFGSTVVSPGNLISNNTATAPNGGGGLYICNSCSPSFMNNNIYGNKAGPTAATFANDVSDFNIATYTLDGSNNYWGTTNTSVIDRHIHDFFDDGSLGVFNYLPIRSSTIPLPDLRIGQLSNPPATSQPGKALSVAAVVGNAGGGSASATTIGFYLSPTPTKGAGAVKLGGSQVTINLASGASTTGKVIVMVPSTTPTGAYYLIACANDNGLVLESNKTNNCRASTTQVTVQ
jgi:parallel beta-helix repeat protein